MSNKLANIYKYPNKDFWRIRVKGYATTANSEKEAITKRDKIKVALTDLATIGVIKIERLTPTQFSMVETLGIPGFILDELRPNVAKNPCLYELAVEELARFPKTKGEQGFLKDRSRILFWAAGKADERHPTMRAGAKKNTAYMTPKCAETRLLDLTPEDFLIVRKKLKADGVSDTTNNRLMTVMRGLITRFIRRHSLLMANPIDPLMSNRIGKSDKDEFQKLDEDGFSTEAYLDHEVEKLIAWGYKRGDHIRDSFPFGYGQFIFWGEFLEFMAFTGIRVSYVLDLKISDIKIDKGQWFVAKDMKWRTKSNQAKLPLTKRPKEILEQQWELAENNSGYFFPKTHNTPYGDANRELLKEAWPSCLDEIKPGHKPFHSFRAYMASRLHYSGIATNVAAEFLGMTENVYLTYVTQDSLSVKRIVEKLDKLDDDRPKGHPPKLSVV